MPRLDVRGLGIHYEDEGAGEPLVLVTCLGGDVTYWGQQVPAFVEAGYRCISIDNRDCGESDASPIEHYTTRDMADDVAAVITDLGVAPAHVLGWSMGGLIAQELALNHPSMVRTLTLLATHAGDHRSLAAWAQTMRRLRSRCTLREHVETLCLWGFGAQFLAHPGAVDAVIDASCAAPHPQSADAFGRQCGACITHNTTSRLASIQVPTHVIVGEEDLITPVDRARLLADRIPGARLTVLPGVGHCACWENPIACNEAALSFMKSPAGAARVGGRAATSSVSRRGEVA